MFSQQPQEDKACCPFNPNHIFAKEKLIFHLNRCKDKEKVIHLYRACKYNGVHYYKLEEIEQHQQICPDKQETKSCLAKMRRNFDEINRERQRSRQKRKRQEREKNQQDQQQYTLSECDECMEALKYIQIEKYPKIKRYLLRYQQIKRDQMR